MSALSKPTYVCGIGWQKQFYHDIKERGRTESDPTGNKGNKSLMNTLMQLRKVRRAPTSLTVAWTATAVASAIVAVASAVVTCGTGGESSIHILARMEHR